MSDIVLSQDSGAKDILEVAMCVHRLFGELPVTAKSRNRPGVRIEAGKAVSMDYTGPVLEHVLKEGRTLREKPEEGPYKGIPVVVSPILVDGKAIAAIGVVDTSGSLEIKALMDQYSKLEGQVRGTR